MRKLLFPLFVGLLAVAGSFTAHAAEKDITVSGVWARPMIMTDRPGAAYFQLHNTGAEADRLLAASTPGAARVELHVHEMDDGVMKMRQVPAVDVPAGGMVAFKPGGYHVMIFGMQNEVHPGEKLPLTLTFEKAGEIRVEAEVTMKPPADAPMTHRHEKDPH